MSPLTAHSVLWASPSPLWGRFGVAATASAFSAADQARPALLRFASDEFMQQTLDILAADPRRLGEVIAHPETWRNPSGATPEVAPAAPLPRLARVFARMRTGAAASTSLQPTTDRLATVVNGVSRTLPLKLYHPAHQRHYLVAANLVCGVPGFPDHRVAGGGREQVGFVLRRLMRPAGASPSSTEREEFAFVKDGAGARWQRVTPNGTGDDRFARTVAGEEMLPLFPLNFADDAGHPRRIQAGLIPVGRREEYMSTRRQDAAPAATSVATSIGGTGATPPATVISERKEQLKLDVTEPWKQLIRAAHSARARMYDNYKQLPNDDQRRASALKFNQQAQQQSWLILLDFADYLAHHLPNVWDAVRGLTPRTPLSTAQTALLSWITTANALPVSEWQLSAASFSTTLAAALAGAVAKRADLEGAENVYPFAPGKSVSNTTLAWPGFFYLLAGIRETASPTLFNVHGLHRSLAARTDLVADPDDVEATPGTVAAETDAASLDKLVQLVIAAIDASHPAASAPPVPFAAQLRDALKSTAGDEGWFRIRCAYVRCDCGPLQPTVLSVPSQQFQLASFFDPDAPARPIRIALPIDTSAAGLRKHNRNTAFVISDVLCGQLQRAKGLGLGDLVLSVLPWPFHKDLDVGGDGVGACKSGEVNIGMICSLSIPIITICALILLFMIVLVLDFIFKWIPWFIMCFPLPKFRAKQSAA